MKVGFEICHTVLVFCLHCFLHYTDNMLCFNLYTIKLVIING